MKPKTNTQFRVVELSAQLPDITEEQKEWGFDHCVDKSVVRSRKTLYCLECGHSWKDPGELSTKLLGETCPSCNSKLKLKEHYSSSYCSNSGYYAILTTKGEFQVVRLFFMSKYLKKHNAANLFCSEVMQHWIDEKGNVTSMSKRVQGLSSYYDSWIHSSNLEVRPKQFQNGQRYNINPFRVYPQRKISPKIKRNGFRGYFHDYAPHIFFSLLLNNSYFETLLKTKQYALLKELKGGLRERKIVSYWPSIRICIRNGYTIDKPDTWLDYVSLLEHFGKDLLSPKYVCPADLDKAHNRLVDKKRLIERKKKLQELRDKLEEDQREYTKKKARFFDICIVKDNITIRTIESVQEFLIEGDAHRHCVFENEYYKRDDSLILSAQIEGKRAETVEVSLKELKVLQSRGLENKPTRAHRKIVNIVESNMSLIAERMHPKRKQRKFITS